MGRRRWWRRLVGFWPRLSRCRLPRSALGWSLGWRRRGEGRRRSQTDRQATGQPGCTFTYGPDRFPSGDQSTSPYGPPTPLPLFASSSSAAAARVSLLFCWFHHHRRGHKQAARLVSGGAALLLLVPALYCWYSRRSTRTCIDFFLASLFSLFTIPGLLCCASLTVVPLLTVFSKQASWFSRIPCDGQPSPCPRCRCQHQRHVPAGQPRRRPSRCGALPAAERRPPAAPGDCESPPPQCMLLFCSILLHYYTSLLPRCSN